MGEYKDAYVHVRVSPLLKKAVKMHCVRVGLTEQAWVTTLIEVELAKNAPDLLMTAVIATSPAGEERVPRRES